MVDDMKWESCPTTFSKLQTHKLAVTSPEITTLFKDFTLQDDEYMELEGLPPQFPDDRAAASRLGQIRNSASSSMGSPDLELRLRHDTRNHQHFQCQENTSSFSSSESHTGFESEFGSLHPDRCWTIVNSEDSRDAPRTRNEEFHSLLDEKGEGRGAERNNLNSSWKNTVWDTYRRERSRKVETWTRRNSSLEKAPSKADQTSLKRAVYPDFYSGPGPVHEVTDNLSKVDIMEDGRRRDGFGGGGGGYRQQGGGGRKRMRRDDDRDDRPARRNRYEEPPASKLRREILVIGETPSRNPVHEALSLGKRIAELFDDDQVHGPFMDTMIELIAEQPFKIPNIAAVILYANDINGAVAQEILVRSSERAQVALEDGHWREFKLIMRFYACLQSLFEGDGIFSIMEELFNRAADQQTASSDDVLGLELVKIILLALPYAMASGATGLEEKAKELLEKTDIIASVQHPLEDLSNPFPFGHEDQSISFVSALHLLQKQLVSEDEEGWKVSCLPRLYQPTHQKQAKEANGDDTMTEATNGHHTTKHVFPALTIPVTLNPGSRPLFPEAYLSVYADQEVESVPRPTSISASLIRDAVADTINILDFNRVKVANYLIEVDCFFASGTFAARATPFDKLKDAPEGTSTWKPEDVIVDAIFSQMLQLPSAEHKLVYYHSVITEACKVAPAAIAPTLGRAIRFLFRNCGHLDLELTYRFMDWFTHHLSNFDFRWKWTEWSEDVNGTDLDPKKAFIIGAIDKEIRLSFAKRIMETLPNPYHKFITEGMFKDTPDFKFEKDDTPYAIEGRQIQQLIRKRSPESEIENHIEAIQTTALENGETDPLIPSTDAYVTSICFIGSKSLSHVLSCIERCKERLLAIGPQSEAARRQIIASVLDYWRELPGTAVNIVDKLLNYTIVTPESVLRWSLGEEQLGQDGRGLVNVWRYEMVASTMGKVTNRVRQIVKARIGAVGQEYTEEQIAMLDETLKKEREAMRALFLVIFELLKSYEQASGEAAIWAARWVRAFRRKSAVEESFSGEQAVLTAMEVKKVELEVEKARQKKEEEERERRRKEREAEEERRLEEETRAAEEAAAKAALDQAESPEGDVQANGGAQELDVADDDL